MTKHSLPRSIVKQITQIGCDWADAPDRISILRTEAGGVTIDSRATGTVFLPMGDDPEGVLRDARALYRIATMTRYGVVPYNLNGGRAAPTPTSVPLAFTRWLWRRVHITSNTTVQRRLNINALLREFLQEHGITLREREYRSLFELLRTLTLPGGKQFIVCVSRSGSAAVWEIHRPLRGVKSGRSGVNSRSRKAATPATAPPAAEVVSADVSGGVFEALAGLRDAIDSLLGRRA